MIATTSACVSRKASMTFSRSLALRFWLILNFPSRRVISKVKLTTLPDIGLYQSLNNNHIAPHTIKFGMLFMHTNLAKSRRANEFSTGSILDKNP